MKKSRNNKKNRELKSRNKFNRGNKIRVKELKKVIIKRVNNRKRRRKVYLIGLQRDQNWLR